MQFCNLPTRKLFQEEQSSESKSVCTALATTVRVPSKNSNFAFDLFICTHCTMRQAFLLCITLVSLWLPEITPFVSLPAFSSKRSAIARPTTALNSGYGTASNYTWNEEAFEIDVSVKVPPNTKAKDVIFKATSKSIDLRLKQPDGSETILMDANRKLRGRVNLDGTYWVISDAEDDSAYRDITVTIEKLIRTPKDDFEVIDYDWKGVYSNDEDEVTEVEYDKPEVLDVREYAASMGVDIDNINMSMVDKTMFSSGLNLTQNSLDELTKAGYMKEVTQQADGTEYVVNDDGQAEPFSPLGEAIGEDEMKEATPKQIPFLDTSSPWHDTVPVQVDKKTNKTYIQQSRNFTRAAFAADSAKEVHEETLDPEDGTDPIDTLTVKRLKEILKAQGLKVSGTKKELQDRLREQVNSLLQGKQE